MYGLLEPLAFKRRAPILLYGFHGIQLDVDPAAYGWTYRHKPKRGRHHLVIGEFIYCGLLLDGEMVVSEADLHELVKDLDLKLNEVHGPTIYFKEMTVATLRKMHALKLTARCIGDQEAESDDDENFTFHLLVRK